MGRYRRCPGITSLSFLGADEMNRIIPLCVLMLLLLTAAGIGLSHADSISSSIICDGAAWLSASVIGPEENYASRFFSSGPGGFIRTCRDL